MITLKKKYKDLTKEECCQTLISRTQKNSKLKLVEDKFSGKKGETVLVSEQNHNRQLPLNIVISKGYSDLVVKIGYTPIIHFLLYVGILVKTTFFLLLYFGVFGLEVDTKLLFLYPVLVLLMLYIISILSLYVRASEYFRIITLIKEK